jgi:spore germination protein GerM
MMKKRFILINVILVGILAVGITASGCGKKKVVVQTGPQVRTTPSTIPSSTITVTVFFLKAETLYQVSRVANKKGPAEALAELLKGPTEAEKQQGVSTSLPEGTKLRSFAVENGKAKADFSNELKNYGGGSARLQAIINQINSTVISNDPAAATVEITVEGVPSGEALQP